MPYVAVDAAGNAYLSGSTTDCAYPTTAGAYQTQARFPAGSAANCTAGFVSKLNPTGNSLLWSTFIGDDPTNVVPISLDAIALGSDGSIYVAGNGSGGGYPGVNAIVPQAQYYQYSVISRLNPAGTALLFSTTLSGTTSSSDNVSGIAVDALNNIYVAGITNSFTMPITAGAFQLTNNKPNGANYTGFVAKIAPTITSTTTLTLPSGTVTAGQSATFTAKVAGAAGSTGTPTGTITFLSGSTTLGTGTLDATGTATYTAASLNATTYNVTASYPGDSIFSASVSAVQSLVVSPAVATVALAAPATATPGASVTLTAKVTGTPGTPTGSVTFKDGTTVLSTVTLASGSASFTSSTLSLGAHAITAGYSGDATFSAATSAASTVTISAAPAITFAATPASLTVTHGLSTTTVLNGTPVGGYTGTVTFACGTLPAGASCTFAPATLNFTGNNVAAGTTLTLSTMTTTTGSLQLLPGLRALSGIVAAVLLMPIAVRRRRIFRGSPLLLWMLLLVGSASVVGLGGCSGSSSGKGSTTVTTTPGTYTVPVTITAGAAVSTVNLSVTVQ